MKKNKKTLCVNPTCVFLRKHLSLTWLLNVTDMLSARKEVLKYINSAKKKNELILIFSKGKRKSGLKSTEVMPINPLLSDSSVGKGRFMKWQAPKKSERAHLNDFDYSSPQPCLWFWKGGEYSGFCLWTDAKPSGQAGNGRARRGERDRHGAIMKMNANGGKGSHGRSRSMEKGVLKNDMFKEHRGPNCY